MMARTRWLCHGIQFQTGTKGDRSAATISHVSIATDKAE